MKISFYYTNENHELDFKYEIIQIANEAPLNLSALSLSFNLGKLYIHGGNTGVKDEVVIDRYVKNGELIILDLQTGRRQQVEVPNILKEKLKVSGSTTHWIGGETLIMLGGSEPLLGNKGRSILLYTSAKADSPYCHLHLQRLCLWKDGMDGMMIYCEACHFWFHRCCDKTTSKKKENELPKAYYCVDCRRKRRKRKAKK